MTKKSENILYFWDIESQLVRTGTQEIRPRGSGDKKRGPRGPLPTYVTSMVNFVGVRIWFCVFLKNNIDGIYGIATHQQPWCSKWYNTFTNSYSMNKFQVLRLSFQENRPHTERIIKHLRCITFSTHFYMLRIGQPTKYSSVWIFH
jgi:hypothetical protein